MLRQLVQAINNQNTISSRNIFFLGVTTHCGFVFTAL